MTAREAYDCDSTFRALVDEWVRERRCPLPLVDRCLELDLEAAADCARWAATEPERPAFVHGKKYEPKYQSGPYPNLGEDIVNWYWCPLSNFRHNNVVPRQCVGKTTPLCPTPLDAILWVLNAWVPESADAAA